MTKKNETIFSVGQRIAVLNCSFWGPVVRRSMAVKVSARFVQIECGRRFSACGNNRFPKSDGNGERIEPWNE